MTRVAFNISVACAGAFALLVVLGRLGECCG